MSKYRFSILTDQDDSFYCEYESETNDVVNDLAAIFAHSDAKGNILTFVGEKIDED